ncbi:MAG: TIR domain-containing protein [Nitrospira sp.]|nr:TIR domain-containing protein [Nitrospira sp.]
MDRQQESVDHIVPMLNSVEATPRSAAPKRSYAARLFGYDIFISFALGPPPRGTRSYASDLTRRLREADYTVFFSEDEAPVGNQLDSTLHQALLRSHALVVIANRETLEEPRWVRTEVEEFRKVRRDRPIVPINVGGALQDGELSSRVQEWLAHQGNIWINESNEAVSAGLASDDVVNRLATAPNSKKANQRWRWMTRTVFTLLAALAIALAVATFRVIDSKNHLEIALRNATALRLNTEAQTMLSGARPGGLVLGLSKLLAAHRIAPHIEIENTMWTEVFALERVNKIIKTNSSAEVVRFSPDGRRFLSGSGDGTVRLWDAQTGQPIGEPLKGHNAWVRSVAFSPDGTHLLSGGADGTVRRWDAETGQSIGVSLKGPKAEVMSMAFSPDGRRLVTGSKDGILRLWNSETGQPIGEPLDSHGSWVTSVAFSPDGRRLVSGSLDKTLRLWPAPDAWPNELCAKLTRNMSRKEWREQVSPDIEYREQCPGLPIPPDAPAQESPSIAPGKDNKTD